MAQQDRPPRSLRSDGEARYFRDWNATAESSVVESEDASVDGQQEARIDAASNPELQMVEGLDSSEPARIVPVHQEMAPLKVIVPDLPEAAKPTAETPKPKVTRVEQSRLQRARRYTDIKAEEEAQQREIQKEQTRLAAQQDTPVRPVSKSGHKTAEFQNNLKEMEGKLDEAKENVKGTAQAISENIRQVSERLTESIVGGIQKFSQGLNGFLQRGKRNASSSERTEDFDDDPIPTPQVASSSTTQKNLLDRIPFVPEVHVQLLAQEGVMFWAFDKQPLILSDAQNHSQQAQARFIEQALQDIRKCVKLVRDLPDPKEGPYAGIPLAYIFKHVREQDLFFFMHYVISKPEPFRKKTFKLSEAFGTWILKRSHQTIISEPFPEINSVPYFPLYRDQVRFLTHERKQLVLTSGKSPTEIEKLFMERALEDVRACVGLVEKFPAAQEGPYKGRPLKQIFRNVRERDIYFFLSYVQAQPEVFRNQNFKFSEAFASWILKRSHETLTSAH